VNTDILFTFLCVYLVASIGLCFSYLFMRYAVLRSRRHSERHMQDAREELAGNSMEQRGL
jgi:hypothetical protein